MGVDLRGVNMRSESLLSRQLLRLQNLSIRAKLYVLVGILVADLAAVISLGILGMGVLSSVRAYVGGEGLWAKAQKDAIYSLSKYAFSHREKDHQDYLDFLKVPLGDRTARLELSKPDPDLAVSDRGFLEGKNHPEDVRGMASLFRRFRPVGHIRRAIEIWTEADGEMVALQALGERLHAEVARGPVSDASRAAFLDQLEALNARLTRLENDFSATMGEAARWAKRLLVWTMVLGSLALGALSLAIALYISRGIAGGVSSLSEAAAKAAQGDLSVRVQVQSLDELGRLARSFNAMVRSLARIDQLKNDFISTVSHELRTPLTLNLAPLEALLSGDHGPLQGSQRAVLGVMMNNALRLLQMVNGLLDFSRLQAGKMAVSREATDIGALCASLYTDLQPAMARKGLRGELRLPAGPLIVDMDRYLFERIAFNLLSNAVKFTPSGGQITVGLDWEAGSLALRVQDTGIGISEADAGLLFKKFSQAEASSTRRFEGTGLGLALVKECSQLLGGGVSLASRPGLGSTFTVTCLAPLSGPDSRPAELRRPAHGLVVPADNGPLEPPQAAPSASQAALPRVLIAEDNAELADFIRSLLSSTCDVKLAGDGEAALAEARRWRPDLVLSDVMMPCKDGLALCREIKADPAMAATPVILLTALTGQEDLLLGWEAGADDYLFKPFHPRELQARVRTMLAVVAWRLRSDQYRKRQEILEQFTRIASHDLKAPIRRISSYAGLLLNDYKGRLDPEAEEHLGVIVKCAAQMHSMIQSLLQFSRFDSNEAAFKPCDLNRVAAEATRLLEPEIRECGAVVNLGPLPELDAVPEQVFALFQNLIGNSLKYRLPERRPVIELSAVRQDSSWIFTVADNGRGFDPSQSEAVFAIFKRLEGSDGVPGEGMGLAIARKVVETHGGRIWAEAKPGAGAAIHFTLPAAPHPAAVAA